jgi:phosphatidylglycerol lysyltransferase
MIKNRYITTLQSILVLLIGLGLVIQPAIGLIRDHFGNRYTATTNPYVINASQILMIIGFLMIYLAFYLYSRRKVAYIASIILIVCVLSISLFMRHKVAGMLVLEAISLTWMLGSRRFYQVKSDLVRMAFGVRISLLIGIAAFVYVVVGLLLLGKGAFHHHFSLQEAAIASFQTLFTFNDIDTPTTQATVFVYFANIISIVLYVLIIGSLFKPVRFALGSNKSDKKRVFEILQKTSTSSEDYFKLWPDDKHYYFSSTRDSFLAYKTSGKTAIILGDPGGNVEEFKQLISHFNEFVSLNGWHVAAINVTSISEGIYKQEGLNELFVGNEAIITIADYVMYTTRSKHFRYINNVAQRDGLTVEYWETIDDAKVRLLKGVSDSWLSHGGRKEYTFFMGYFDPMYLKACSVMVLKQGGAVVGYINVLPSFIKNEASIDHFRARPGISSASMHFLLKELIDFLSRQGKTSLNIGFAPLSGIEIRDGKRPTVEKLLKILKKFGNRYYSFKGVEQFKGKFQPVWHPRNLYYSGNVTSLTVIVSDIERASRLFSERSKRRKVIGSIIVFLVIAATVQFI